MPWEMMRKLVASIGRPSIGLQGYFPPTRVAALVLAKQPPVALLRNSHLSKRFQGIPDIDSSVTADDRYSVGIEISKWRSALNNPVHIGPHGFGLEGVRPDLLIK